MLANSRAYKLIKPNIDFASEMMVTNNDMPNDLLGKYLNGEATPHEILLAQEWISASDANGKYFEQLKIAVEANNSVAHNKEAWLRLQNQINKNHSGRLNKPGFKFKARWVQLIVAIALLCLMGYIIRLGLYSDPNITLNSDTGVLTETLPDGTSVTLNAHSKLSYMAQFAGKKRVVSLIGEAVFRVAADFGAPFIVNLKGASVSTTDATLLIKNRNGKTEISVEKGTAKLSTQASQLILKQGEVAISGDAGMKVIKSTTGNVKPTWIKDRN